jgi:hypothetical protein
MVFDLTLGRTSGRDATGGGLTKRGRCHTKGMDNHLSTEGAGRNELLLNCRICQFFSVLCARILLY